MTLTSDVTASKFSGATDGQVVTFQICQDAKGGHQFNWPAQFSGGMAVGRDPGQCSVQSFIFDAARNRAYALAAGVANQ